MGSFFQPVQALVGVAGWLNWEQFSEGWTGRGPSLLLFILVAVDETGLTSHLSGPTGVALLDYHGLGLEAE
jgi:hypothetical protein